MQDVVEIGRDFVNSCTVHILHLCAATAAAPPAAAADGLADAAVADNETPAARTPPPTVVKLHADNRPLASNVITSLYISLTRIILLIHY